MKRTPARLALAAVLALLGLAPPLEAAREPKIPESMLASEAGCGPGDEGRLIAIVDASAADDCDQTPEAVPASYVTARCICNHGTLEPHGAALTGANFTGPVSISLNRGTEGDETLTFGSDLDEETAAWLFTADDQDAPAVTATIGAGGFFVQWAGETQPRIYFSDNFLAFDRDGDGQPEFVANVDSIEVLGCNDYGPLGNYASIVSPGECDTFYDTTLHAPCHYTGAAWKSALDGTTNCTASEE